MAKIKIPITGYEGLAPRFYGDKPFSSSNWNLRTLGSDNQMANGIFNPIAKLGYLSPTNHTYTTVAYPDSTMTTIKTFIARQQDYANADIYFLEGDSSTNLVKLSTFTGTSLTEVKHLGSEISSTVIGTDLEMYQVNGVQKLFFSYVTTTGDIGIYDISADGLDGDFFSTQPTGASTISASARHKMIVADNGYMYILDANAVHKFDGTIDGGTNGTATMNVLLFPPYFYLTDGCDFRGRLWIGLTRANTFTPQDYAVSTYTGVYVWDRQSTEIRIQDFIPILGVKEVRQVFPFRETIACFTISNEGLTQLRMYNGSRFEVVAEAGLNAWPHYNDGYWVVGDRITWLGYDGIIYTFGRPYPGMKDGLVKLGSTADTVTAGQTTRGSGVIIAATDSISTTSDTDYSNYASISEGYYITLRDTSDGRYFRRWHPHAYRLTTTYQNPHPGYNYTLSYPLPKLSTVKSLTLFYPSTPATGTAENMYFDVYFNQSSSTTRATTKLTDDDGNRGWKYIPLGERGVNYIQFSLRWRGVHRLGRCITPAFAELEYNDEPTRKL